MPTLYWRGTTDGDFSDANNWVTAAGATPGAAPAGGDTLIFDSGNVDVDAGLTTGLTGVTLRGTAGYTGRIGPTSPLDIACTSLHWKGAGSLNLTGNIATGKVMCRTGSSFMYQGGTATLLYIDRTSYSIGSSAVVTTLRTYRSNGSDLNNATGYTLFEMDGGIHTSRRLGVFKLDGSATLKAKAECQLDDGTRVGYGSTIEYSSSEEVSTGDTVEVTSTGKFNAASSPVQFSWDGTLAYWPGASINLETAAGEVTPNATTTYGYGDDLTPIPLP